MLHGSRSSCDWLFARRSCSAAATLVRLRVEGMVVLRKMKRSTAAFFRNLFWERRGGRGMFTLWAMFGPYKCRPAALTQGRCAGGWSSVWTTASCRVNY